MKLLTKNLLRLSSRSVNFLPGQINIVNIEQAGSDVVIDGFFTTHYFILMSNINLMDGLSLLHQQTDNCIKSGYLFFPDTQTTTGFRNNFMSFNMSMLCIVEAFHQSTLTNLLATMPQSLFFLQLIRFLQALYETPGYPVASSARFLRTSPKIVVGFLCNLQAISLNDRLSFRCF